VDQGAVPAGFMEKNKINILFNLIITRHKDIPHFIAYFQLFWLKNAWWRVQIWFTGGEHISRLGCIGEQTGCMGEQ
jgi:hypothetical protein